MPANPATTALASLLLSICTILATCGGPTIADDDPAAVTFQAQAPPIDKAQLAQLVHDRVNAIRVREHLSPLAFNPDLAKIATGHSNNMVGHGYFAHKDPANREFLQRYEAAGFACKVPEEPPYFLLGAENLALVHRVSQWRIWQDGRKEPAVVLTVEQIADAAVQGWWDSPGHRKNLLTPQWLTEGIGVAVTADGRWLITQNFC